MEHSNPDPNPSSNSNSETTPLLPPPVTAPTRARRTVTFHENPVTKTIEPEDYSRHRHYDSSSSSSHVMAAAPLGGIRPNSIGSLTGLNGKLKRRTSANGSAASTSALSCAVASPGQPKIGPQRSTKTAQKLKELPLPDFGEDGPDEESGREVYSQYTRIKDPKARRHAARLGKADRNRLPRVTAYCTANKYQLDSLMRWLKSSARKRGTNPKRIDECLYSPFSYTWRRDGIGNPASIGSGSETPIDNGSQTPISSGSQTPADSELSTPLTPSGPSRFDGLPEGDMFPGMGQQDSGLGVGAMNADLRRNIEAALQAKTVQLLPNNQNNHSTSSSSDGTRKMPRADNDDDDDDDDETDPEGDLDISFEIPEIFLFDYGVVVIWGMTEAQEVKLLKDIRRFSPVETLEEEQIEAEFFNFFYAREPRIYNDFIALKLQDKRNYMTKLAISHGLAQSVKTNLYEELIAVELEGSKDLPAQIAMAGKMALSKTEINMKIGKLFILRIQVHLNGSVLDTPELFWTEPHLEPVYKATRRYLEMDQRIEVLANRLSVIGDLLTVLKDQLSHGHGEMLEWIGEKYFYFYFYFILNSRNFF